jgi:hypothetical protein
MGGNGAGQDGRWRWRVSHLIWGAMTIFMMAWAFFLGLLVGQGALGTPEQMDSLRGLTRTLPGMRPMAPDGSAAPLREEARLTAPDLGFWDEVVRGPADQPPAAPTQPKPAAPAAQSAPAAPAPLSPEAAALPTPATPPSSAPAPVKPSTPVYGKLEPFRPETAPPIGPPVATARPAPAPAPAPPPAQARPASPAPQAFHPQPQPYRPGPGQAATAAAKPAAPAAPASPAAPRQGRFTVQVASLQDEYQARGLVSQLKASGHTAYLVRVQTDGVGVRYRVRVGPYDDFDRAQGAASRIRLQQTLAAYVTREE